MDTCREGRMEAHGYFWFKHVWQEVLHEKKTDGQAGRFWGNQNFVKP